MAGAWTARDVGYFQLPELGDVAYYATLASVPPGKLDKLMILSSTGTSVSAVDIDRLREARRHLSYGKLSERLAAAIASTSETTLRVTAWYPGLAPRAKAHGAGAVVNVEVELLALAADRRQRQAASRAAAIAAAGRHGLLVASPTAMPAVEVVLSPSAIAGLAAEQVFTKLELSSTEKRALGTNSSPPTLHFYDADDAEALETFSATHRGTGVRVGVYEWSNDCGLWRESSTVPAGFSQWSSYELSSGVAAHHGCNGQGVSDGQPCSVLCNNGPGYCRGGRCVKRHVTLVASKIGSVRDGEHRNASQLAMYFANTGSRLDRLNWLAAKGVTVINDSEEGSLADYAPANWTIRNDFISLTKAAGNSQGVPVICFENSICVGSYAMLSAANIDWWKPDRTNMCGRYGLAGSTAHIDWPSRADSEKPDVVANGEATFPSTMVDPQAANGWGVDMGSSLAAPMVAGQIAVLQQYFNVAKFWPELVRPMLMVSAIDHNVTGTWLSTNGGADEQDGAGVPTSSRLKTIVDQGTYRTLTLTPSAFCAGTYCPSTPLPSIVLTSAQTVRVILGWMHCSQNGSTSLSADFDLRLLDSQGNIVASSASWTNSLEMLQFTAPANGTYTMQIRQYGTWASCEGVQREYAGLAWTVLDPQVAPSCN